MATIKCRMQLRDGTVKTYKSKNGRDFKGPQEGIYKAPLKANGEILERVNWLGITIRRAYYHQGIATAIPVAKMPKVSVVVEPMVGDDGNTVERTVTKIIDPEGQLQQSVNFRMYGPDDIKNLEGDFIANKIEAALRRKQRDEILLFITVGASVLGLLASAYTAWMMKGLMNMIGAR